MIKDLQKFEDVDKHVHCAQPTVLKHAMCMSVSFERFKIIT